MASKFGGIPVTGSKFGGIPVTGFRPVVIPEEEDDRTLGDSVNDFVANFGVGTGQVVSLLGSAYGLATGDMENRLTASGARTSEFWEKRRTPAYKEAERARQEKIDATEGELQKAGVAIWETLSNPMLLVGELAKQVPNLAVGGVGGAGGKVVVGTAGKVFGREVSEQALTRAGAAAATGTGVGLSSADFGQSAYEQLMSLPDEVWLANPQVQERIGGNMDLFPQVKREIATGLAQNSAIAGGLVTYGLNKLPGAKTIEKALGGEALTGTRLRRAATGFAGETLSEGLEEGATQLTANIAQAQIDPNARLTTGLGQAAGLGAVTGGGLGLISGALAPGREAAEPVEELKFGEPQVAPAEVSAEQASDFARTRLEELISKGKGTPDTEAVDPVTGQKRTVPGRPAQFLSDNEKAELEFLVNNARDPNAIADAYNLKIKASADQRLNEATNVADAIQAAADMVDLDIEALEREAGISIFAEPAITAQAVTEPTVTTQAVTEPTVTAQAVTEPGLTVDVLSRADISAMPAPERQEFLSDLTAARTANLPEQREQALARAAETYGRTVGPIQQPVARQTPAEAISAARGLTAARPEPTAAPDLNALLAADTRAMDEESRADFNAQLAMARTNTPGPVQTAALNRAAEIYGRTVGPIQTRQAQAPALRTAVPRPTRILGRPAAQYTEADLQAVIADNRTPAVTRRGAEIELRARTTAAPVTQETIDENFISLPEALPDTVTGPVAGQSSDDSARASAQRTIDQWAASQGVESPVTFDAAPADLQANVKEIADLIGSQWGGRVVAFSDSRPGAINGVAIGQVAYVNVVDSQAGVQRTALHEFKHTVEQIAKAEAAAGLTDTPAQDFVDQIDSVFDDMTEEGKRAYLENFMAAEELADLEGDAREERVQELLESPELRSEMVADFLGNRATDKKFWQDLAKADPTGFESFVQRWLAAIDNLLAKLRGAKGRSKTESAKVDSYIRDLNRAKLTAQSALINYRKATAAPAEVEAAEGEVQFSKAIRGGRVEQAGQFTVRVQKDGSIGVQGDAEAIRAQLPDDVKGRKVEGGMVFTPSDAPRVRAALQGRKTAYSRGGEVIKALPVKDGKYVGAPQKYNTPAKIPTLRRNLRELAKEGEPGRYWYENSGREILKLVGGDAQEARKLIALLSIYSPQAKVDANSTFALRAWAQYKAGQPINVKTRVSDEKAQRAMNDVDAFWSGEKTGNFYTNLLREIDSSLPQGATIDLWMMRAGEYSSDAPSPNQYAFMENEINRLAQELGWEPQQVQAAIWVAMKARMENAGVKKRTEASSEKKGWIKYTYPLKKGRPVKTRVVVNAQAHRDNWLKHAFEHEPTVRDTQTAKFDFSDGLRRHIGQLSWEARPGRTTGVLPGVNDAPFEQQVEFQQAVQKAILDDDGVDLLAYKLGMLVDGPDILAPGVWQGEVAAGMQKLVAMAPGFSSEKKIDSAQKAALDTYASVLGLLLRQEGIGYHRPFHKGRRRDENGVEVNIGRPMTDEEAKAFWQAVDARLPEGWEDDAGLISYPNGMRVVNLGAMEDNLSFQKEIKAAAATLPVDSQVTYFSSDGDLIKNDWKENPDGQSYRSRISATGSPDLLEWAGSVLAPRIQAVFEEYSAKYGWGDPGRTPLLDEPRFSRRDGRGRDQSGAAAAREVSPLPGAPQVKGATGPDKRLVSVARKYAEGKGIPFRRQGAYVQVDEGLAKRLAQAYEEMPHAPNAPLVKEAYRDLIQQTTDQYRALTDAGYKFYFFDESNDPYQGNPWNAMRDLRANQVMGVFSTVAGFGSSDLDVSSNPLLKDTGITWPVGFLDSQERAPVLANDLFRAVHDAFGHGLEGAGFRAQGEENAWQAHSRLFTGPALGALTSETRGQNSWLNYGPNGEANRNAKVEDTVFADQKTGLMPEWAWTEGVSADEDPSAADEVIAFSKRQKPAPKKTVTAYKLFRVDPRRPGQIFPLFVNANDPVPFGEWQDADIGPLGEGGKVKSKLGLLAFRPGWHAGDLPIATHIGQKSDSSLRAPDQRADNQVWAEVELAADRDWQGVADERGKNAQGKIIAARAHITDQVPEDGFYRYKTSPNMVGKWLIGGSMKVNRLLSDAEVASINAAAGTADLPRPQPFNAKKYGFDEPQFSRAQKSPLKLYSALERAAEAGPARAPAQQWKGTLRNQKGVTPEEIEWSGVNDWLDLQTGQVSRDDVVGYLAQNGVQIEEAVKSADDSATKYAEYVEPGGTNYREVLLKLPAKAGRPVFTSKHWRDDKNVLAHIRVNDRLDDEGNEVLFVEELQSDWAQQGREEGFYSDKRLRAEIVTSPTRGRRWVVYQEDGTRVYDSVTVPFEPGREQQVIDKAREFMSSSYSNMVFRGPFVGSTGSWLDLALKRVVAMAVEEGYAKVAFSTGDQNAKRYSMDKTVSRIELDDNSLFFKGLIPYALDFTLEGPVSPGTLRVFDKKGDLLFTDAIKSEADVRRILGKEISNKLIESPAQEESLDDAGRVRRRVLEGPSLEIGGEGMRTFYDGIVPKALNKLLPKIGGDKVQPLALTFGSPESVNVPSFDVTPAMTDQVMDVGLPLFSRAQNIFGRPMPAGTWQVEDRRLDTVIYNMQDKLIDTKRVVESINSAVGQIEDKWDPYLQEKLYHGAVSKQTKDFAKNELKPLIETMGRNKVTIEEFDKYLHNRHAEERNAAIAQRNPALPDAGSGIATADAKAYLAALPAARKVLLEGLARRIDTLTEGTRKILVASGLEAQSTIDAWDNVYKKYVPLMREELDYEGSSGPGTGRGFSVRGSASRRAVGSADRKVVDILANLVMQRERAIVRATKNKVSQALYGLALKNPSPDFWMPINPDAIKDPQALTSELIAFGVDPLDAENIAKEPMESYVDPRTGLVSTRVNRRLRNLPNVVYTRVNGKDRFLVFNSQSPRAERMAKAINNLDMDNLVAALSMAAVGTRWFASVNTQYNPIFGVVNLGRDLGAGALNLTTTPIADKKAQVIADSIPALRGIYRAVRGKAGQNNWANLWDEFQEVGGQTGFRDQFSQSEERARALQRELDDLSSGVAKKSGKAVLEWLSDYNTAMENAVRLSAYKAALDKGMSKQRAAELAKDLTVNFNKKGAVSTNMGALYAFFNASVQGTTRLAQTLAGPAGKKIVYGGLLLGSMQALLLMAAGFEDDEPPGFIKERNLVIPIGGGDYLTWPMPLGFNVIPNIGRITTEWALSGFERTPDRAIEMATSFFDMFNPIGNAGLSIQTLAPTVTDPFAALAENKDWTGAPISREDLNSLAPTPGYLRARDSASWLATELSRFFNLATGGTDFTPGKFSPTPEQLEYLAGQITGGVGRETGKAVKTVESLISGEELPPYSIPLAGRLYGKTTGSAAESNRFYENIRRMNLHNAELRGLRETQQPVGPYLNRNPEARLATQARTVYRQVQNLRKRKREMLDRNASRESIRLIEQQITNRMKSFNERMSRIES